MRKEKSELDLAGRARLCRFQYLWQDHGWPRSRRSRKERFGIYIVDRYFSVFWTGFGVGIGQMVYEDRIGVVFDFVLALMPFCALWKAARWIWLKNYHGMHLQWQQQ